MKVTLKTLGVFILWNLAVGTFLIVMRPLAALVLSLALTAVLLWGYLLRSANVRDARRRWATLRLRPLRDATLGWSLAGVPVFLLFAWAMGDVYTQLVPVPAESLNPFEPILQTAEGRLAITVFAVAIAPIVEEFVFRGLIQGHLERRSGPRLGILLAAAIFAAVHLLPWVLPLHFLLGLGFGAAVWAARSIWTGVILHAANNSAAMLGAALSGPEPAPTGTLWITGATTDLWSSLSMLLISALGAFWVGGNLYRAARRERLRVA